MNITPHTANLPLATVVNPPTEGLRRENNQREIITQVSATSPALAEKGVASDKERARTPAQTNEQVDFANLRKQAEHSASSISEQKNEQQNEQSGQQQGEQDSQENQDESQTASQNKIKETSSEEQKTQENSKEARTNEKIIGQLTQRDKEVRTHELAHSTAGGSATGSPSYTFEVGPDGKKYAVNGEVSVDLSSVSGDPQATITKMQRVHAAALAPANPSSQDARVAATAAQKILSAQSELMAQKQDSSTEPSKTKSSQSVNTQSTFHNENKHDASKEFDTLINQTLSAQENISPSSTIKSNLSGVLSSEVQQRSHRIESFYFNVSQGYEKPDNFQFELTA